MLSQARLNQTRTQGQAGFACTPKNAKILIKRKLGIETIKKLGQKIGDGFSNHQKEGHQFIDKTVSGMGWRAKVLSFIPGITKGIRAKKEHYKKLGITTKGILHTPDFSSGFVDKFVEKQIG